MKKLIIFLFIIMTLISCSQHATCQFGGNSTIKLEPGEKLVEVIWKYEYGDIWYLVEPMDSNYVPKTKVFKKRSMTGVIEGSVTFIETK